MRRVVITGVGVVSSIGGNAEEVTNALRQGKSGITRSDDFAEHGFRCQVWARPPIDYEDALDRRTRRFMGEGAAWNYIAMQEAIADSGIAEDQISHPMTGIIMGSGGPSTRAIIEAADKTRANKIQRKSARRSSRKQCRRQIPQRLRCPTRYSGSIIRFHRLARHRSIVSAQQSNRSCGASRI